MQQIINTNYIMAGAKIRPFTYRGVVLFMPR